MFRPLFIGAALLSMSMAAIAQPFGQPGPRAELIEACRADVQRFCQGIRPGQGRIRICIKANRDRLSPECKAAIMTAIEQRKGMREQRRQQWQDGRP